MSIEDYIINPREVVNRHGSFSNYVAERPINVKGVVMQTTVLLPHDWRRQYKKLSVTLHGLEVYKIKSCEE